MSEDLPSGAELLALLIQGKPTGTTVFFDNGTGEEITVLVSDAPAVFATFPKWILKNKII